tara:strand:+ start:150 stop:566 length:417 start_codon:yes stop_codon:yes gene_type:complete
MRTRRTELLPPSGLCKKVFDYAMHGKGAGGFGSAWLISRGDKIYVRGHNSKKLELATWRFNKRGTGHAKMLLSYLETLVLSGKIPQTELFVESVTNQRFAEHFRRRDCWVEVGSGPHFLFSEQQIAADILSLAMAERV